MGIVEAILRRFGYVHIDRLREGLLESAGAAPAGTGSHGVLREWAPGAGDAPPEEPSEEEEWEWTIAIARARAMNGA